MRTGSDYNCLNNKINFKSMMKSYNLTAKHKGRRYIRFIVLHVTMNAL